MEKVKRKKRKGWARYPVRLQSLRVSTALAEALASDAVAHDESDAMAARRILALYLLAESGPELTR